MRLRFKMNFLNRNKNTARGFTLIELLVVIAIISLLASVVLVNLNGARQKTRDVLRKSELRHLQSALEIYYSTYGSYPDTGGAWYSSEPGDEAGSNNGGDWIPGLAPDYIGELPTDPKGGESSIAYCNTEHSYKSAFLYISNGVNYKLLSNCAFESISASDAYENSDSYYDPVHSSWAWMVTNKPDLPPGGDCTFYDYESDYPVCW